MKIELWLTGKTTNPNIRDELDFYYSKILHYLPLKITELDLPKSKTPESLVKTESKLNLSRIQKEDYLILLDESGNQFSSKEFASYLEKLFIRINNRIIFISGGAYGFSKELISRSDFKLSLSKMTFTHEMARYIFIEQLYRAMTIIKNQPYQH